MANPIYTTLAGLSPGGVLALPAATFGPGALQDVIAAACDGQVLRATGVTIEPTDTGATMTGTGNNDPFRGLELQATFVPEDRGAGLSLVARSPTAWNLSDGWPVLEDSLGQSLGMSGASLTLGTGAPAGATKGLSFTGSARLGPLTPWSRISWLFAELASIDLTGPIQVMSGIPVFSWTAEVTTPVQVPGLGDLQPTFQLSCAAVANSQGPPFGPQLEMALGATIPLGPGIPVTVDVSNPAGLIAVQADPSEITTDILKTLGDFVGQDLGSFLPTGKGFDPASVVTLDALGFMLSPAQRKVSSAWIGLGTPSSTRWPIADHIDIEGIELEVVVPFGSGHKYGSPFVTASGTVTLPHGGLQISGAYANEFSLAAGLTDDSQVKITDLLDLFLRTSLDADLYLDELDMTAVPGNGAWSLMADLKGDWGFDVGVVRVALTEADVSLDHDPTSAPATTGTINATAVLGGDTSGQFTFSGLWTLPETFRLSGAFPDIDVTKLAARLTGNGAPPGAPAVELTDIVATIELQQAAGYDFSLTATAATGEGTELGTAALEVRKNTTGFGFLIGFDLPAAWSPAQLWSPLGTLFGGLTFKSSGMVISTLANTSATLSTLHMPSVPATVGPGVTFFTSLELAGGGLDYLAALFPDGTELDLLGVIDTATPANSKITAELTEPTSQQALQIHDLILEVQPATTKITATIDAEVTVGSGAWAEHVAISGGGCLQIEPEPDISLFVDVKNWSEPFGIRHLVVVDFGLRVNLIETGLDIGLGGEVRIGQGDDTFSLTLGIGFEDFEVPDWLVFELQPQPGKTLMLPSLIADFVPTLDLSKVPVLNQIGFKELEFYMVEDPGGIKIGDHTFPQGIGLACDVVLYSWEITLSVQVNASKGIKAAGSVNHVIDLFDVLTISDVTGTTGPAASIDTSGLMAVPAAIASPVRTQLAAVAPAPGVDPPPYLWLDGKIELLGVSDALSATVTKTGFDFDFKFKFLDLLTETITCSLVDEKSLSGSAAFDFDLDFWIGPWIWKPLAEEAGGGTEHAPQEGIELMPRVHIIGPRGSVNLSLAINQTVIFDLGFGLTFSWGVINVAIATHLTADKLRNDLENMWDAAVSWMEDHLDEVFAELKADAEKWAEAIKSGLFAIALEADAVAHALHGFFEAGLDDAASVLKSLEYDFEDSVKALVHWFEVSVEDAVQALADTVESCAMSSADAALDPVSTPENRSTAPAHDGLDPTMFELTRTPQGQRLLLLWYVHADELTQLVAGLPGTTDRMRAMAAVGEIDTESATVAAGIDLLAAVQADAGPELREAIAEVLPALDPVRDLTWSGFVEHLGR